MIVVAIIGILIALVVAFLTSQTFKGNDAKRKADLDRIKIAVEEYEKDHDCYPEYIVCGVHEDQPIYPYLNNVPCDPITNASYFYEHDGSATCPGYFRLYTVLQNTKDLSVIMGLGPSGAFNYEVSSNNAPVVVSTTPDPTGSPSPTSAPIPQDNFYGCINLVCTQIIWDPVRPGPECDPNYQNSTCYGQCSNPNNECVSWN